MTMTTNESHAPEFFSGIFFGHATNARRTPPPMMMNRLILTFLAIALFAVESVAQRQNTQYEVPPSGIRPPRYTYVRPNESKRGDYKVVTVPGIQRRQAMIDAQTYHRGWDAVDAWMGQSRVMYNVLLRRRAPYVPGTPPVPRPIPKERR